MMVHHMEALGHAIQVLRTERRMSRAALARAAALSYPYVSEIETGHKCSLAALYAIASGLNMPASAVLAKAEALASMQATA